MFVPLPMFIYEVNGGQYKRNSYLLLLLYAEHFQCGHFICIQVLFLFGKTQLEIGNFGKYVNSHTLAARPRIPI
jgi:hypothetical protein